MGRARRCSSKWRRRLSPTPPPRDPPCPLRQRALPMTAWLSQPVHPRPWRHRCARCGRGGGWGEASPEIPSVFSWTFVSAPARIDQTGLELRAERVVRPSSCASERRCSLEPQIAGQQHFIAVRTTPSLCRSRLAPLLLFADKGTCRSRGRTLLFRSFDLGAPQPKGGGLASRDVPGCGTASPGACAAWPPRDG